MKETLATLKRGFDETPVFMTYSLLTTVVGPLIALIFF